MVIRWGFIHIQWIPALRLSRYYGRLFFGPAKWACIFSGKTFFIIVNSQILESQTVESFSNITASLRPLGLNLENQNACDVLISLISVTH